MDFFEIYLTYLINPRQVSIEHYALFLIVHLVGLTTCAYYLRQRFNRRRVIQDTPTSKIRSAAQGYVELAGRQKLLKNKSIASPLTQERCTWWRYKIERYSKRGKHGYWYELQSKTSQEPFLLDDYTGTCVILPDGADVRTNIRRVWYDRHNLDPKRAWQRKTWFNYLFARYRYTEEILRPGRKLFAMGNFRSFDASNSPYDDGVKNQGSVEKVHTLSGMALGQGCEFLLSELTEKQLINQNKQRIALYLVGVIFLALHCAYALLARGLI